MNIYQRIMPGHSGMGINFHFAQSIPPRLRRNIRTEILRAAGKIPPGTFPMREIDVWAAHWYEPIEHDISGHAYYHNTVTLKLNPKVSFAQIEKSIPYVFYHELHHLARIGTAGFGQTLEDCVVTEGLAETFCAQMGGRVLAFKNKEDLDTVKNIFYKERKEKDRYWTWFPGRDSRLPRFAGYILGYLIVSTYCAATHKKPSQLYTVPTDYIIEHQAVRKFLAQ